MEHKEDSLGHRDENRGKTPILSGTIRFEDANGNVLEASATDEGIEIRNVHMAGVNQIAVMPISGNVVIVRADNLRRV